METLSEVDLRGVIIKTVNSYAEVREPEEKEILRERFAEAIELAFSDPSYADLRQELLNAGYVHVERGPYSMNFFRDFDRARLNRDIGFLDQLMEQDPNLYSRALQERVLSDVRTIIYKIRMEDVSVEEEINLRGEFKRLLEWIPGLDLPEITQEEIIAEREVVRDPIPMTTLISSSLDYSGHGRGLSINELTDDNILNLSDIDIFRLLRELYGNYIWIPRKLVRFCETGVCTDDDISYARQMLQGNYEFLQYLIMING